MEIKEIKETKNLVFERKEIQATAFAESAPTKKDVATALAKKISVPEDAIKIKGIYGKFGAKEFRIEANIYKSKEEKNKIERKTKKEIEEEKKEAEAAKKAVQEAKKAAEEAKKAEETAKQEKTE
jgi:ribosomal protein S24E